MDSADPVTATVSELRVVPLTLNDMVGAPPGTLFTVNLPCF
jgi:hypothetical protein